MSVYLRTPGRSDCHEIFQLEISQKEGELATATVMLKSDFNTDGLHEATIMYGNNILLKGEIHETPSRTSSMFTVVRVISHFKKEQIQKIASDFCASNNYNKELANGNMNDVTEEHPARFFFSRTSGDVKLSNIVDAEYKHDIRMEDYWSSSIKTMNEPLSKVNMHVTAQWIQERSGMIDVFQIIANLFPEKRVNSLNNLKNQWWQLSRSLPKSCYSIGMFKIKRAYPSNLPHSCSFNVNKEPVKLKRFWFDGIFNLHWHYRQKIEETLNFTLNNHTSNNGTEKNIYIKLNELTISKSNSSFFESKSGEKIVRSVARRAFNHMLAKQRNTKIEICGKFEKLYNITVDDTVRIQNKDKYIIGKVVQTTIKMTGDQRFVKLKISTCLQNIKLPNIKYETKDCSDTTSNIIEDISVENPPSFQIDSTRHMNFKDIQELKSHLVSIPTKIRIKLKNLNTVKCLKKTVYMEATVK